MFHSHLLLSFHPWVMVLPHPTLTLTSPWETALDATPASSPLLHSTHPAASVSLLAPGTILPPLSCLVSSLASALHSALHAVVFPASGRKPKTSGLPGPSVLPSPLCLTQGTVSRFLNSAFSHASGYKIPCARSSLSGPCHLGATGLILKTQLNCHVHSEASCKHPPQPMSHFCVPAAAAKICHINPPRPGSPLNPRLLRV